MALGHRPESRETLEQAIELRFELKTSLVPLGAFERIVDYLREAEGLARTLDDQRRLAKVSVHMCHILGLVGDLTEVIAIGQNAQTLAESLGDVPLQVTGNLYLGAAYLWTGDYRRAEDLFLNVLRLLEGELSRERFGLTGFPAVIARAYLTWSLTDRGEFKEGIVHGQEGIRLAEALETYPCVTLSISATSSWLTQSPPSPAVAGCPPAHSRRAFAARPRCVRRGAGHATR